MSGRCTAAPRDVPIAVVRGVPSVTQQIEDFPAFEVRDVPDEGPPPPGIQPGR